MSGALGWECGDTANMFNRPIESVVLSGDKEKLTFRFSDGFERSFGVEGDCCSHSWIEHITIPTGIAGAVITDIENIGDAGVEVTKAQLDAADCLAVYQTQFATTKGHIVLEYRNDSNGYYGGYLVDA